MLPRKFIVPSTLTLLLVTVLAAGCSEKQTNAPAKPDDEDERIVGGQSFALIEGRTVEVDIWHPASEGKPGRYVPTVMELNPKREGNQFVSDLILACVTSEFRNATSTEAWNEAHTSCRLPPRPWQLDGTMLGFGLPLPLLYACAGHWATHIAESTEPTRILARAQAWSEGYVPHVVFPHGNALPKELSDHPLFANFDSENLRFSYQVRPPSASDRASWALLAAELHRRALLVAVEAVSDPACDQMLSPESHVPGVSLRELLLNYATDTMVAVAAASDKAQRYIAAASDAATGTRVGVSTPAGIQIAAWRERHDSRLEGVAAYVPITERLYERPQLLPLWRLCDDTFCHATTNPHQRLDHYNYQFGLEAWWIYPPDSSPENHTALRTWRGKPISESGSSHLFTTSRSLTSLQMEFTELEEVRLEGWVPNEESADGPTRFVSYPPYLSERVYTEPVIAQPNTGERYPVVTLDLRTQGQQLLERLLRDHRINPCTTIAPVPFWCAGALAGIPERTVQDIGDDLLRAMKRSAPGAFSKYSVASQLLTANNITWPDVERVASRIVQASSALGRPIVRDESSVPPTTNDPEAPSLVFGTEESYAPAHPAYLYAITAGKFEYDVGATDGLSWRGTTIPTRGVAYAATSIVSAMDYLLLKTRELASGDRKYGSSMQPLSDADPSAFRALKLVRGLASTYVSDTQGRTRTAQAPQADRISFVTLERQGLGFTTKEALQAGCDAWLGEAGLECALSRGTKLPDCDQYRFLEATDGDTPWSVVNAGDESWAVFGLDANEAPLRNDARYLRTGDHVYGVCDRGRGPEVVLSVELTRPTTSGMHGRYLPPFSDLVLESLERGLSPDPESPANGMMSCAGVPHNVRVPLENELSEATSGADGIESSFAHYIRLAREAANHADALGNDLIQQGLEMDVRSEEAREELEDLCGGVVNVPALATAACDGQDACSVETAVNTPDHELAGVAECLGLGPNSSPIWVGVGDKPLCVWQYVDVNGRLHVPMTCPGAGLPCSSLSRTVLLAPPSTCRSTDAECRKTCAEMYQFPVEENGSVQNFQSGSPLENNKVYARKISDLLNLQLTSAETPDSPRDPNRFACRSTLALRSRSNLYERPRWASEEQLKNMASAIGYEEDAFSFPTITRSGRPWITFGDGVSGFRTELSTGWPYVRHKMLTPDGSEGYDKEAAGFCGSVGYTTSLLCGGLSSSNLSEIRDRLFAGVLTLKGVTGGDFGNVWSTEIRELPGDLMNTPEGMVDAGDVPSWLNATPGTRFYRSKDRSSISYTRDGKRYIAEKKQYAYPEFEGSAKNFLQEYKKHAGLGYTVVKAGNFSSYGWIPAEILWAPTSSSKYSTSDAKVHDTGIMNWFLDGWPLQVSSKVHYSSPFGTTCPKIPDYVSVCYWGAPYFEYTAGDCPKSIDGRPPKALGLALTKYSGNAIRNAIEPHFIRSKLENRFSADMPEHREMLELLLPYACDEIDDWEAGTAPGNAIFDAMDLACAAIESGPIGCPTLMKDLPSLNSVEDFSKLAARISCAADTVQAQLERMYLPELPKDVATALAAAGVVQTFSGHRGMSGETIAAVAAEFQEVRAQADRISATLRNVGSLLSRAGIAAQILELNLDIAQVDSYIAARGLDLDRNALEVQNVRTRQAISNAATACAVSQAEAVGAGWSQALTGEIAGKLVGAAVTCTNSAVQAIAEDQLASLNANGFKIREDIEEAVQDKIDRGVTVTQLEMNALMLQLAMDFSAQMDAVNEAQHGLLSAQARVQGLLTKLDGQRSQARRAAAKVMVLGSDELGRIYNANSAMRARFNTLRVRYEKARDNAVRMAYLARRAVEQKLGVDLNVMAKDMTLVEAPAKWVNTLCSSSGINYETIRNSSGLSAGDALGEYNYADAYVGDWLTKLENFVESYSVDFPFQDGTDTAVLSLRDEIMCVSAAATRTEGWNQLYSTNGVTFDGRVKAELGNRVRVGWDFTCNAGQGVQVDRTMDLGELESPFLCGDSTVGCRALGGAEAYRLSSIAVENCSGESSGGSGGSGTAPTEPPADQLRYWYRADHCTETSANSGYVTHCDNLAPGATSAQSLRLSGGGNMRLLSSGLGGKPALDLSGPNLVTTRADLVEAFSVAVVMKKLTDNNVLFSDGSHTSTHGGVTGGTVRFQSVSGSSAINFTWTSTVPASAGNIYLSVARNSPHAAAGNHVVVATSGPTGTKIYIDGVLGAVSDVPMTPQTLNGNLFGAGAGAAQLAEHITYYKELNETEVEQLNEYLIERYAVDRGAPMRWIEADDVWRARTSGGTSPISGYGTETQVHDRVHGINFVTASNSTLPLQLFGTSGHYGLAFDGNESLTVPAPASVCPRLIGQASCAWGYVPYAENLFTAVARVDSGSGMIGLMRLILRMSPTEYLGVKVDAGTGALLLEHAFLPSGGTAQAFTSEPGVVLPGQPFVLSVKISEAENQTRIYVDGSLVLVIPGFAPPMRGEAYLGMATAVHTKLVGLMGEFMHDINPKSEADILALHAQLGEKYAIEIESAGGGGTQPGSGDHVSGPARMRQVVPVVRGDYWLSWYQSAEDPPAQVMLEMPNGTTATVDVDTQGVEGGIIVPVGQQELGGAVDPWLAPDWERHYVRVTVPVSGNLGVGFLAPSSGYATLAAPQLERVQSDRSSLPRSYFPTTSSRSAVVAQGEDTDGSVFRTRWHRGCEYYCPPGSGQSCASGGDVSGIPQRCFYETDFALSYDEIEKGALASQAGFARGNFNYRFDDVAVNLVGTGVKNCESSGLPSACYGANFLQYSIRQSGPFHVRNYEGNTVKAALFPGQIQQAKALLAERYLTNPLSSADRNMLTDYWRRELKGRPIDGGFKLRIYDSDGLDWNQLRDVQLVLRYRYWTRLN